MSASDRSQQSLGRRNQREVLAAIAVHRAVSRTEIARRTGLHAASVSRITKALIEAGIVREKSPLETPGKPGRRFVELEIDPRGGFVVGIAINALEQSVTLADIRNNRVDRVDLKPADLTDHAAVIDALVATVNDMLARNGVPVTRVFCLSVAIAGLIEPATGMVIEAPTLNWRAVPLADLLAWGTGLRVTIEHLPNAINLAEHRFGATVGCDSVLLMNTALGIGSSLLLGGQLHRDRAGSGRLTGNLPAAPVGAGAGRNLDLAAGGRGVLVEMGATVDEVMHLPAAVAGDRLLTVIARADHDEDKACEALAAAGRTMGIFTALAGSVVQPEAYVLSGLLSRVAPYADAWIAALGEQLGVAQAPARLSTLTTAAAARWLAISHCLIDSDIAIEGAEVQAAE